jgi:putative tricarboxylic transport membrane protein
MADRVIFSLTVTLAAVYLYATEQFPSLEISDPLGPKAFPRLLGIALLLTAGGLLLEMVRARKIKAAVDKPGAAGGWRHTLVVSAAVIWTALYFAVFERLGYALSTTVYLLGLMAYFHRGKWLVNLLTPVLYSFISYWMFTKLLDVTLARGILPF